MMLYIKPDAIVPQEQCLHMTRIGDVDNMTIDHNHIDAIGRTLNCHDVKVRSFQYDPESQALSIELTQGPFSNIRALLFRKVLLFQVTGIEPWGHDCAIIGWQSMDQTEVMHMIQPVLQKMRSENELLSDPLPIDELVSSELVFASGDKLQVICTSIDVSEVNK